jgi:hypothetical protein
MPTSKSSLPFFILNMRYITSSSSLTNQASLDLGIALHHEDLCRSECIDPRLLRTDEGLFVLKQEVKSSSKCT